MHDDHGPVRCHTPDTSWPRRPDGYVTHPAVAAHRGCVTVQETVNVTPGWANSSYVNTTERCTDYPYMPEWDEPYFANSTLELTLLNDSWAEGLGDPNTAEGSYPRRSCSPGSSQRRAAPPAGWPP